MERYAVIVAGFGFRAGAQATSLEAALAAACSAQPNAAPGLLATARDKAATEVFANFAAARGLPVRGVSAADLAAQETATQSAASAVARGTGSVAEAAALAAAGPGARLLTGRVVSPDRQATCALAIGDGT